MEPLLVNSAYELSRRSRVDEVVDTIDQWIVKGDLLANETLPSEADLAVQFRVSRTVVREAVRLLYERGLIEMVHGRRHRVKPPVPEIPALQMQRFIHRRGATIKDLMEVRLSLEVSIAGLAAQRRTEKHLSAMRSCIEEQSRAQTLDDQVAQDGIFHQLLAQATGNSVYELVLDSMRVLLVESRRLSLQASVGGKCNEIAVARHTQILEAVDASNVKLAEAAMFTHINSSI